jgi:hypothetical protein
MNVNNLLSFRVLSQVGCVESTVFSLSAVTKGFLKGANFFSPDSAVRNSDSPIKQAGPEYYSGPAFKEHVIIALIPV